VFSSKVNFTLLYFVFRNGFSLTKEILQNEGVRGMFRGLVPTMGREMPGYFFFFGGYEFSKNFLTKGKPEEAGM